jgi:hypothetical protein
MEVDGEVVVIVIISMGDARRCKAEEESNKYGDNERLHGGGFVANGSLSSHPSANTRKTPPIDLEEL